MSQALSNTPRTRPRWRPRFSLRTLLLASLFCDSGMLLWRNRAPWAVKYTIQEEREIQAADFSPNDKYTYTLTDLYIDENQPRSERKELVKIYDAESGRLQTTIASERSRNQDTEYSFSPGGNFIHRIIRSHNSRTPLFVFDELWSVDTGKLVRLENQKPDEFHFVQISSNDHFALLWKGSESILVKLPSLEVVARIPSNGNGRFSPDEKWLAFESFNPDEAPQIISTELGEVKQKLDKNVIFQFSPDGCLLVFSTQDNLTKYSAKIIELSTAKTMTEIVIMKKPSDMTFSPDGRYLMTLYSSSMKYVIWDWSLKTELFRGEVSGRTAQIMADDRLLESNRFLALDIRTGKLLWKNRDCGYFSPNGAYAFDTTRWVLLSGRTGKTVHKFGIIPGNNDDSWITLNFANKNSTFLTYRFKPGGNLPTPLSHQVQVWHRRRPEFWYGFAWLPEFWLTVVLAGVLLWSLSRPLT